MKESLVKYLASPITRQPLQLVVSEYNGEEIMSGQLTDQNGNIFQIIEGIPRLLDEKSISVSQAETRDSFNSKWEMIPSYRKDTSGFYQKWYVDRYGFGDLDGLGEFLKDTELIVEAGTGMGRDILMYSENSAAQVIGIDITNAAIEQTYSDLGSIDNLHLVQADLSKPPIKDASVDFLACDQVIHHTPDIRKSFKALARLIKKGGYCAIYVYSVKSPIREFSDDFIRNYTTKMSVEDCYEFSKAITDFGRMLSELEVKIDVPSDIVGLDINEGKYDLQRFFHWNIMKCFWNSEFEYESNVMINFDWYHPELAHRRTPQEVSQIIENESFEIVHTDIREAGTSILAKKN